MYCTTKTLKYILYLFDFLCAAFGIVLIRYGVWLLNTVEDVKFDHGESLAATFTIMLGIVLLLIGVYGSVAVRLESKSMLIAFAVILVALLVIQLIAVSISYTAGSEGLSEVLKKGFDELMDKEEHQNSTLSYYEEWLHCCGKNSAEDYFLLDKIPPASCCKDHDCTNVFNLYVEGCELKFKVYVRHKTYGFNVISCLLIFVEFICSILACILVDSIRNHRDRIRLYS